MINKIVLFICSITCIFSFKVDACSTFLLEKDHQLLLAKSYDWIVEDGLLIVNKRHIAKQAMTIDHPMQWISKYGSIVFTQAGRELPMGGMNEVGLAIELMWLDDTTYPIPDTRSTVYELQWIQYQLDTASTIEEVLASDKFLRIDGNSKSLIHFILVDSKGKRAIIEFLDGKMIVYTDKEMQPPVLTNNTYQKSLHFLKEHQGFGGERTPKEGFASLDRFVRISTLLKEFSTSANDSSMTSAFRILSSIANFGETTEEVSFENMELLMRAKWNIVYDVSNKKIHFLTGSHQKVRTVQLNAFNFDGNTEVQILDVQAKLEGDVSHRFIPYTYELNRNLIDRYYNQVPFLKEISEESRELTAKYPEKTFYVGQ